MAGRTTTNNPPKLNPEFVKTIGGRDFVLYAGLLDLAHSKGLMRIEVKVLQYPSEDNGHTAIVQAVAESKEGELFSDLGDANPSNCDRRVAQHILRMASTRAKARCLRDMTNIGMTCLEELAGEAEVIGHNQPRYQPATEKTPGGVRSQKRVLGSPRSNREPNSERKLTDSQKKAIKNIAKRRKMSDSDLKNLIHENTGLTLQELSVSQASDVIQALQS